MPVWTWDRIYSGRRPWCPGGPPPVMDRPEYMSLVVPCGGRTIRSGEYTGMVISSLVGAGGCIHSMLLWLVEAEKYAIVENLEYDE